MNVWKCKKINVETYRYDCDALIANHCNSLQLTTS